MQIVDPSNRSKVHSLGEPLDAFCFPRLLPDFALGFGVVLALGDDFAFAAALSLGFEDVFELIALSRRRGWGQTKKN